MGKNSIPKDIRQNEINYICRLLNHNLIATTMDLEDKFEDLINQINQNPEIFKEKYSLEQCFQILKKAIAVYTDLYAYKITLKEELKYKIFQYGKKKSQLQANPASVEDDLTKVTKSYDRLEESYEKEKDIHKSILRVVKDKEFLVVPQVIIGSGDTGTTIWLEKFKDHHGTCDAQLRKDQLPPVLMIGEHAGNWKHNYTLAQPHSILERTTAKENPSAYLSTDYYQKNPHANGRHIYQANQTSLALTEAPWLQASILRVEKKINHLADWEVKDQEYRIVVKTPGGIKTIYTNELNICTGLGPARNILAGSMLTPIQFERLNQFDPKKKFTPIVDGNQFILAPTEERCPTPRKIVIYGGGGTAAACYRKGFFGHDIHTEHMEFNEKNQKNSVVWVAKQFDKAGTGKLATTALSTAKNRDELIQAELIEINPQSDGKLSLKFKTSAPGNKPTFVEIACDQLIYSVGQDDTLTRSLFKEVETDLALNYDHNNMVLNVCSADKKVIFYGAAAMAVREKEYMEATWKWLHSENIGGDVGPGSMPPTRAQIRCDNFWRGMLPTSINANMDSHYLIVKYIEKAGIDSVIATAFVKDLLQARKSSTCGASHSMIVELLKKYELNDVLEIKGHGHLVLKTISSNAPPKPKHQLLSWLAPQRATEDATVFVSSTKAEKTSKDTMEKRDPNIQLIAEIRS
ncbi:hypothetical protein OQJ18_04605 [Fluoribacter dumoffii]|uniref:hypothetical protein n=1 Tax=Fluoribacter dumoffii TaxID=463 RepID=UPI002244E4F5|nr:hypothetical protein [Fluoribacter dumoffii]MCW8418632.1 hypothetical protein [Fluoribacter dumoffii]MCW8453524.1 hypothetical protein [Fluoribacter dumoffii]MCW8459257.1 hypothetical protein [Fluoribacter dumoffii]MCW8482616.1 hypothetical protein [Fluoribacter dumoffii]